MVGFGFRNHLPVRLGQIMETPGALAAFNAAELSPTPFLVRHASGDWGDVSQEDAALNNEALVDGTRILSSYKLRDGETTIWIITEADRSVTTILLPSEY